MSLAPMPPERPPEVKRKPQVPAPSRSHSQAPVDELGVAWGSSVSSLGASLLMGGHTISWAVQLRF